MKWKDVILGSLVTMGVAVVAGVLIYYLTREPHRPELKRQVWELLNEICPQAMLREGRVYGGGLHKLEPKELGERPGGGDHRAVTRVGAAAMGKATRAVRIPLKYSQFR